MTTVFDLKIGEKGIINNINGNDKLARRLLALGCINNTEIEVKKIAPFGDPILVSFRGFNIAIRKADAKNIVLQHGNKLC